MIDNHYIKARNNPKDKINDTQHLILSVLQFDSLMDLELIYKDITAYCRTNSLDLPTYLDVKNEINQLINDGEICEISAGDIALLMSHKRKIHLIEQQAENIPSYSDWL